MKLALFFHIIILLGGLQGIITGTLLFREGRNRRANRYLGVLLWLIALASVNLFLEYTGWYYSSTTIAIIHNLVPLIILMPTGPLLYFYVKASIDPAFRLTNKQRLHFLPVILDFLPSLTSLIFIVGVKWNIVYPDARPWGAFIDLLAVYSDIPRWTSLTLYAFLSVKQIARSRNNAGKNQAEMINWLEQFIKIFLFFQLIWLLYLIPYVIPATTDIILRTFSWYPVYIPLTFLIYWLGTKGLIVAYKNREKSKRPAGMSGMQPDILQEVLTKLKKSMEVERLFLNPDLNLERLSQSTGIPSKAISAVLNQHLQKSFNEFVNGYRVDELKKRMNENPESNLTILGMALECGFNSKASFQRIFKEMTGVSPGAYQKITSKAN